MLLGFLSHKHKTKLYIEYNSNYCLKIHVFEFKNAKHRNHVLVNLQLKQETHQNIIIINVENLIKQEHF